MNDSGENGDAGDEIGGCGGKFCRSPLDVVNGDHENREIVLDIVIVDHEVGKFVHKS